MNITFVDELPDVNLGPKNSFPWGEAAKALAENPGQWGIVLEQPLGDDDISLKKQRSLEAGARARLGRRHGCQVTVRRDTKSNTFRVYGKAAA